MTLGDVMNVAIGAVFGGGGELRDEGDDASVSTHVAANGVSGDTIEFEGRAWPRDGAARAAFAMDLATRTQDAGKAAVEAAERALAQARAQANAANRAPADHVMKVNRLLNDELERDARAAVEPAWAEYSCTGTTDALFVLGDVLQKLRERELHELGPQSYVTHRALLAAIAPAVRTHVDPVLNSSYAAVTAALLGKRLALRDGLGTLERLLMDKA